MSDKVILTEEGYRQLEKRLEELKFVKRPEITERIKEEAVYEIVGTTEADISVGRISNESPLGKALVGAKVGQTVTVKAPKCSYEVKVLKIEG